jgi:hypothetical protein
MKKPEFTTWAGQRVMSISEGMHAMNRAAILTATYDELHLSRGNWADLSFLATIGDKVQRLSIVAGETCDVGTIAAMSQLRYLRLDEGRKPAGQKDITDFSALRNLEECYIGWKKTYSPNLFDCPRLRLLSIWNYDNDSLGDIARATQLRSLDISASPLTKLDGIEHLSSLEHLRLGPLRKLESLSPIERVTSLTSLSIGQCPQLANIANIHELKGLEHLGLTTAHPLQDLEFLTAFPVLREFVFDCQIINVDFAPVFRLKRLATGRFITLRDYSGTDQELANLAREAGRTVNVEVLGKGRKAPTVTLTFRD